MGKIMLFLLGLSKQFKSLFVKERRGYNDSFIACQNPGMSVQPCHTHLNDLGHLKVNMVPRAALVLITQHLWAGTWGLCFKLTGRMLRTVLETSLLLHFVSVLQMRSLRTLLLEWYKQQSPPLAQGSFLPSPPLCSVCLELFLPSLPSGVSSVLH